MGMGMSETQEAGRRKLEKLIQTFGCLPDAGDGPILPSFGPKSLAKAIEHEVIRAGQYGWSKVTIHMDIPDAVLLMNFLKKAADAQ